MENLVGLWPNVSRAYEIALLGNYSIEIGFDKSYIQGFDDYKLIKDFYLGVDFVQNGDLFVEIYEVNYNIKFKPETLLDIQKRVDDVKDLVRPTEFNSTSCDSLLDTAINRLKLSLITRKKIIEVACVIAQLSKSKTIKVEHIAEAIHYHCLNESICLAEKKSIKFGKGIEIALHELDNNDVEQAIEYLNSLKL
jgi:hypothetical protein